MCRLGESRERPRVETKSRSKNEELWSIKKNYIDVRSKRSQYDVTHCPPAIILLSILSYQRNIMPLRKKVKYDTV